MTFETLLKKWNKGIERGAVVRFARAVGVANNTVSQWISGKAKPAEEIRSKVASLLGVSVEELMEALRQSRLKQPIPEGVAMGEVSYGITPEILARFTPEELDALKRICDKDTRKPWDVLRWLVKGYASGRLRECEEPSKNVPGQPQDRALHRRTV